MFGIFDSKSNKLFKEFKSSYRKGDAQLDCSIVHAYHSVVKSNFGGIVTETYLDPTTFCGRLSVRKAIFPKGNASDIDIDWYAKKIHYFALDNRLESK